MKEYLISDFTDNKDEPVLNIITEDEVIKTLDVSKKNNFKIRLFEIKPSLLDWT